MTIQDIITKVSTRRDYYVSLGWDHSDCWIGFYDGMMKLASDSGASTYRDRGDGVIIREAIGQS
jgi:hypothetical protein